MRKFLFFLILLPALVSLGHDIYIYTLDQQRGFRLSDIGALWDTYHKESHDQWKIKLQKLGGVVSDLSPIDTTVQTEKTQVQDPKDGYYESFTQTDIHNKASVTSPIKEKDFAQENTSEIQKYVGFFLEQKAVFVFAGFAAVIFLLNAFVSWIFRKKTGMDELDAHKKRKKQKSGEFKYNRK